MSNLTTKKYRIATGERVATFRITIELTADEIAHALADHNGAFYEGEGYDGPVDVTEKAIRSALTASVWHAIEIAGYRSGDEANGEDIVADYTEAVVEKFFGGRQYSASVPS